MPAANAQQKEADELAQAEEDIIADEPGAPRPLPAPAAAPAAISMLALYCKLGSNLVTAALRRLRVPAAVAFLKLAVNSRRA
jgi:hypothetical protein